jgi:hypothetical protein
MGMYTELSLGVEFKKNLPEEFISIINFMVSGGEEEVFLIPERFKDHELFTTTTRWRWMLRSGGSYYFDRKPYLVWKRDEITKSYFLSCATNIKNYEQEWEKFLDFICPYLDTEGYLGTYWHEEWEHPVMLMKVDSDIYIFDADLSNRRNLKWEKVEVNTQKGDQDSGL